jgi:hypothetical protein
MLIGKFSVLWTPTEDKMGTYKNVMELLTEEAVKRHIKAMPPRVATYMNPDELVAYALNQLPSLYATTEKGLDYQLQKGRSQYQSKIDQAVKRAIAAVNRDPLRSDKPLSVTDHHSSLQTILHKMRTLLRDDSLSWDTLPGVVERVLQRSQSATYSSTAVGAARPYARSHRQQAWQALEQPSTTPPHLPTRRSLRHPFAQHAPTSSADNDSTIHLDTVPHDQTLPDNNHDEQDWTHPLYQL